MAETTSAPAFCDTRRTIQKAERNDVTDYAPTDEDVIEDVLDKLHAEVQQGETQVSLKGLTGMVNDERGPGSTFGSAKIHEAAMELRDRRKVSFMWDPYIGKYIRLTILQPPARQPRTAAPPKELADATQRSEDFS